jgi:hypothetical protein
VSSDNWLWAQRAQELRFHQLEAARKQAESWRTGLAGLTTLFGAVLLVKGRDNLTSLVSPYPQIVIALLGMALTLLIIATLSAVRAASGAPGDECLLTGEDLRDWSRAEVIEIGRRLAAARALTLVGLGAVAVAIGLTWLAPVQELVRPLVLVTSADSHYCGGLINVSGSKIIIQQGSVYRTVPLSPTVRIMSVAACP